MVQENNNEHDEMDSVQMTIYQKIVLQSLNMCYEQKELFNPMRFLL